MWILINPAYAKPHTYALTYPPRRYDESTARKKALENELADLEGKLERAEKLVGGLAGERVRWEASIADLQE